MDGRMDGRMHGCAHLKVLWATGTGWWFKNHLEKYESQWEGWHPIYYGK
jgi:hypothetical protein